MRRGWSARGVALVAAVVVLAACSSSTSPGHRARGDRTVRAANPHRVTDLPGDVRLATVEHHLDVLAAIAHHHDDTRVAGSTGYGASRDYLLRRLRAAGYHPRVQAFPVSFAWERRPSQLQATGSSPRSFSHGRDFTTLLYSGSGQVTGPVVPLGSRTASGGSGSGCTPADWSSFPATGTQVALVQRGTCTFQRKVALARQAGAEAVLVADEGSGTEPVSGTLVHPVGIPVLGVSPDAARALVSSGSARVVTDTGHETRTTWSVIAETGGGDPQHVVLAGAHLDSVGAGPGIVDNGTGAAALLAVAEGLAGATNLTHQVRFAWWGGEEEGLLGSRHYVADLAAHDPAALDQLAAYVNLDMIGSSNFVRLVYGGAGADEYSPPAPKGSARLAQLLTGWFQDHQLASRQLPFDGRSDYDPFVQVGVPTAGLFSGAEGVKTAGEAKAYGGVAGRAYEGCYHRACDTRGRVSTTVLGQMTDALAHLVQVLAQEPLRGDGTAAGRVRKAGDLQAEAEAGWDAAR